MPGANQYDWFPLPSSPERTITMFLGTLPEQDCSSEQGWSAKWKEHRMAGPWPSEHMEAQGLPASDALSQGCKCVCGSLGPAEVFCLVSVVILFDSVPKQAMMWINASGGACILQKPCPTAQSASVPATPRISLIHMSFRHFRLASLQNTESLQDPPESLSPVFSVQKDGRAESSPTNAESRIQTQPQPSPRPALLSFSQLTFTSPPGRAAFSKMEAALLILSMFLTFLVGLINYLLLFTGFKWCGSWSGLVLSKQQGNGQTQAFRGLLTHWEAESAKTTPTSGRVGEASGF